MTASTVLTPYDNVAAIELGNHRWRKQLLPIGKYNYKGRTLAFTREYLEGLISAFKRKPFDQVPFQLATADNKHNNDPERYRGEVVDLQLSPSGLDVIVETTEGGDELLRTNPRLGVSARIYEHYHRSDGKRWRTALQHVLGTLDPHLAGMSPWEEVPVPAELANDIGGEIFDLTSVQMGKEERMPLSKEEIEKIVAEALEEAEAEDGAGDEADLTDEELEELLAEAERQYGDKKVKKDESEPAGEEESEEVRNEAGEEEKETVNATNEGDRTALDLANAHIEQQGIELTRIRAELDETAYQKERDTWVRDYGLPGFIVDTARPLLEGSSHTVELANGDEVDAGEIMRNVLSGIAKTVKILDLGSLVGRGDLPDDGEAEEAAREAKERDDWVAQTRERFKL